MARETILFFLGNGFSQGLGFPSADVLWDQSFQTSHDWYEQLLEWETLKSRYPVSRFLEHEREIRDLELLLTVWDAYCQAHELYVPLSNANQSGRGDLELYVQNLCYWLLRHTLKAVQTSQFGELLDFMHSLMETHELSFATTNYDLVIEKLAAGIKCQCRFFSEEVAQAIPLRKLHGSVAWVCSKDRMSSTSGSFREILRDEESHGIVYDESRACLANPDALRSLHLQCANQMYPSNVAPLATIIPPLVGKRYEGVFKAAVGSFLADASRADHLMIIGYSLTDADPVIRECLKEAAKSVEAREGKVLFMNNYETACQRARDLFGERTEIANERWSVERLRQALLRVSAIRSSAVSG